MVLSPDVIRLMEQLAEGIVCKLVKFIENEDAFSPDFYISATEPLSQLEDLLDYCRLYLPDRPDVVETLGYEREQLLHWAHIANEKNGNDLETRLAIAEAKGHTKGFAERLAKKIQHIVEMAREALISEKPAETEQDTTPGGSGKIGIWLWKLYQKTLKVVVDALLERVWPK